MDAVIKKLLPEILKQAAAVRNLNRTVPISGERHTLSLKGRDIDIAFYRTDAPKAPLIIGLHGGGFLFGGSALDDELWTNVVRYLQANVISVDYRQSPEVMDEASLDDVYDSVIYLREHASEYGFDPDRISVFGSSAGGNLAAALCIRAGQTGKISLANQILMYPFLDGHTDPDSKGEGSFSGIMPRIMNQLHFSPDRSDDPILSPIFAAPDMLRGLPNTIIAYCENDNLRPEAQKYARMLSDAGVAVAEFLAEHMPHGYIENGFKDHFTDVDMEMLGKDAEELISSGALRRCSEKTMEFIREHMI